MVRLLAVLLAVLTTTSHAQVPRERLFRNEDSKRLSRLGQASSVTPTDPLTVGLDRYYSLNGNALDAVSNINGTVSGPGPAYVTGHLSALALNLSSSASNLFSATAYGGGDFSCAYWTYSNTMALYAGVVGNMTAGTVTDWAFLGSGNSMDWYPGGGTVTISASTWHLVVITRSGTDGKVYVDNILVNSVTASVSSVSGSVFIIGSRPDAYTATNAYFQNLGLWSRVLTLSEITRLWNSGAGLAYPFN